MDRKTDNMSNSTTKQISLYLDPESNKGKQTLAYAQSEGLNIKVIDFTKTTLTPTQINRVLEGSDYEMRDLIDLSRLSEVKFPLEEASPQDWVKFLNANPCSLRFPIAFKDDKVVIVKTPMHLVDL
jgi:arsenate reductase-like glutaredoxin family protein